MAEGYHRDMAHIAPHHVTYHDIRLIIFKVFRPVQDVTP